MSEEQEVILSTENHKILKKKVLIPGDYETVPVEGANCQIEITDISCKNEVGECKSDDNSFLLGDNFTGDLVLGQSMCFIDIDIERCIRRMNLHETSVITISYTNKNETVVLEVSCKIKLLKVDDPGLFCDWHWATKVSHATNYKDAGVQLICHNKTIDAFRQFSKALKFILSLDQEDYEVIDETDKKNIQSLKVKLYNNLAFCQLQFNEYNAVVSLCTKVLEIEPNNVKALYRRGSALMGLEDWEKAYSDICQVLAIKPTDSGAKQKAAVLREKVKHINEAYKKMVKSMFV